MLLSAVSVLVVAQSLFEIPEGLMNNPVYLYSRSVHSFVSMAGVSVVVEARVLPPSSGPAVGSGGMPAASFMYPLKN